MNSPYDRREFLSVAARTGTTLIAGAAMFKEMPAMAEVTTTSEVRIRNDDGTVDLKSLNSLLILDRESVADFDQATFHLNPAKKHPENPVLLPGEPQQWDSLQVIWPGTVLYDADDKLFRCWYSGLDAVQKNRPPLWVPGYAESKDGLNWTKPDLGQYKHNDLPTNRILVDWSHHVISTVVMNPDRSDPQRRFLALWHNATNEGYRKVLASSPDGKAWKNEGIAYTPVDQQRTSFFDISQLIFQPDAADENDRVIGYAQAYRDYNGTNVRQIGVVHGPHPGALKEYGTTDEEFLALRPEKGIDEEVHFASVGKFGNQYVMLFESDRFSQNPNHGDLRLAVSSDGRKFRRVHPKTPMIATGPKGMWDENLLVTTTTSFQEVGDEIWIYYFGCPNVFRRWPYGHTGDLRGSLYYPSYLGLATLPRDRFAYAAGPGSITTPSLSIGEQGLRLNADGEGIVVTCLSPDGGTLAEGRLVDSPKQALYRKVQWTTKPPRQPCQIKIALANNQRVYSLRY